MESVIGLWAIAFFLLALFIFSLSKEQEGPTCGLGAGKINNLTK